jgi:membrane protein implicated in regulation of membrane protease activity
VDEELWRWIWLGAAAVFGIGEMVTAGFFLLPFAVGAVAAAILAFVEVSPAIQGVVFLVVSVLALVWLRRYAAKGDDRQPPVGANRFAGETAFVLEKIDRIEGTGRVRMATETWRATTEGASIDVGTEVRIVGVRGTRLVVQPLPEPAPEGPATQED